MCAELEPYETHQFRIFHGLHKLQMLEKRERIIALWSPGVKQTQIVKVVGFSPQTAFNLES